jgi:hypothetical protein
MIRSTPNLARLLRLSLLAAGVAIAGCQAHAPRHGTTRTEDASPVVYNRAWLKENVLLRHLETSRLPGDLLAVNAQFHSTDPHTTRVVYIKSDFYSPPMDEGGVIVDSTKWEPFRLEPRKRVQYTASSLVPADDVRIYMTYGEDISKP